MPDSIDKFFNDASAYFGDISPAKTISMRNIFRRVSNDFNIGPDKLQLQRSLALIIFSAMEDAESDDEVFDNAYRWMSYIAHSPKSSSP